MVQIHVPVHVFNDFAHTFVLNTNSVIILLVFLLSRFNLLTITERHVNDTGLNPYTIYSYVIEATNAFGSVQSAPISFRTPAGAPYGTVVLSVSNIKSKSAAFTWNAPSIMNGPLWKYILYSKTLQNSTEITQWEGQELRVTLMSLIPFTNYIFHVDTCTLGGCLKSLPVEFPTMSAVPEGMRAPIVMAVNNTALHISWHPPQYPNGKFNLEAVKSVSRYT